MPHPLSGLRNLIFDVDGTLLDSRRDIANAQLYVLRKIGVHHITASDIYPLIGKPLSEIFEILLPPELHHHIPHAKETYVTYYRAHALDTTTLFPGVFDAIRELHSRGFRLAIATTKSSFTSTRVLSHFAITRYFVQIQGSDHPPYKPDPAVINKVLDFQKWRREETLMVGDTRADILAGKNAGVRTCGVTWGTLSRENMTELNPDAIVDRMMELVTIAGSMPHDV